MERYCYIVLGSIRPRNGEGKGEKKIICKKDKKIIWVIDLSSYHTIYTSTIPLFIPCFTNVLVLPFFSPLHYRFSLAVDLMISGGSSCGGRRLCAIRRLLVFKLVMYWSYGGLPKDTPTFHKLTNYKCKLQMFSLHYSPFVCFSVCEYKHLVLLQGYKNVASSQHKKT